MAPPRPRSNFHYGSVNELRFQTAVPIKERRFPNRRSFYRQSSDCRSLEKIDAREEISLRKARVLGGGTGR
jgi:hypothetical protein